MLTTRNKAVKFLTMIHEVFSVFPAFPITVFILTIRKYFTGALFSYTLFTPFEKNYKFKARKCSTKKRGQLFRTRIQIRCVRIKVWCLRKQEAYNWTRWEDYSWIAKYQRRRFIDKAKISLQPQSYYQSYPRQCCNNP